MIDSQFGLSDWIEYTVAPENHNSGSLFGNAVFAWYIIYFHFFVNSVWIVVKDFYQSLFGWNESGDSEKKTTSIQKQIRADINPFAKQKSYINGPELQSNWSDYYYYRPHQKRVNRKNFIANCQMLSGYWIPQTSCAVKCYCDNLFVHCL